MTDPVILSDPLGVITAEMARDVAQDLGVCIRPLMRRVLDRETGTESRVAIPCGSTHETVCPPCADKARRLRIQQCAEGWHRDTEPNTGREAYPVDAADVDGVPDDGCSVDVGGVRSNGSCVSHGGRRIRSTRRRIDVPDLPRVPMEARTVGRSFTGRDGRTYRPSMFLTLTLPSYGKVRNGVPVDPASYDYRRAALDAVLFSRWSTGSVELRRCAGYTVQYFAAVEPQKRLAPHLHAALRGAIPHQIIRQVAAATYLQVWWPPFDQPVYVDVLPRWDGTDYVDPATGKLSRPGSRRSTSSTPTPTRRRRMWCGSAARSTRPGSSPPPRMRTGPSAT